MKIDIELYDDSEIISLFKSLRLYSKKSAPLAKSNSFRVRAGEGEIGFNDAVGFLWFRKRKGDKFSWTENLEQSKVELLLSYFINGDFLSLKNFPWLGENEEEDDIPFFG